MKKTEVKGGEQMVEVLLFSLDEIVNKLDERLKDWCRGILKGYQFKKGKEGWGIYAILEAKKEVSKCKSLK